MLMVVVLSLIFSAASQCSDKLDNNTFPTNITSNYYNSYHFTLNDGMIISNITSNSTAIIYYGSFKLEIELDLLCPFTFQSNLITNYILFNYQISQYGSRFFCNLINKCSLFNTITPTPIMTKTITITPTITNTQTLTNLTYPINITNSKSLLFLLFLLLIPIYLSIIVITFFCFVMYRREARNDINERSYFNNLQGTDMELLNVRI